MTAFLDTNVLIYLLDPDETLHSWAVQRLQECKSQGPAIISDMVYREFSVGMTDQAAVDAAVSTLGLERHRVSNAALFRAGVAFKEYCDSHRGRPRTNVLPDFVIGAIAEVSGMPLVTANERDFRRYFPQLALISP
jgi:predicted nucleic acid-binding protein